MVMRKSKHFIFGLALTGLALWMLAAAAAVGQVSDAEREALIDFYLATGGDEWIGNSGWLGEPGTECDWHGVQCASPGGNYFVLRLMLPENNLTGQLPDSLAGLDRLQTLSLSGNDLDGNIPPDLWGLSSLNGLALRGNQLSGLVPAAILAMPEGMPNTRINLSENRLDGFVQAGTPDGPLGHDIELSLANNRIEELPPVEWRATGALAALDLSGNRIEGSLIFDDGRWPELEELNLSGNTITELVGLSADSLPAIQTLDLARNQIAVLPESLLELHELTTLEMGNNHLAGELPEWFADMNLASLGLDNNDLSGPVARVFAAMDLDNFPKVGPHGDLGLHLHFANNQFSGPLPQVDFESFNTPWEGQSPGFGLDLCFNDIELPAADSLEVIDSRHRGLALASCLDRTQTAMDPTISGSWYQPERAGEGLTQMMLDNGQLLSYWFTHAPPDEDEPPRQMWLFGVSEPGESWIEFKPLKTTSGGRFDHGLMGGRPEASRTWIRQNRLDADHTHFFYDYRGPGFCITGACYWDVLTERLDHIRLTHLAGTRCDNQQANQALSGAWYNPDASGEGFIVEVLDNGRGVIYWFTYQPDRSGHQAWMMGDGDFDGTTLTIESLVQPTGTRFGPDFDPDEVEFTHWGSLVMEFDDELNGHIWFDSVDEDYGSGDYSIERLARAQLAECD